MVEEKPYKYEPYQNPPIPTYDEATSSRSHASQSFLGPEEVSHDAERQGLLERTPPSLPPNGYMPPTVESVRSSLDFLPSSGESSVRNSLEGLRREMSEMEVLDPAVDGQSQGARFSKRITDGLSSLHLPFTKWIPSIRNIRFRIPTIPKEFRPGPVLLIRIFALLFILSLGYFVFFTSVFRVRQRTGRTYEPDLVMAYVQDHVSSYGIRQNLEYLTTFDHLAGTEGNYVLAKWIEGIYLKAGLEGTDLERFDVYLNYPIPDGRTVAIVDPPELAWTAKLEEEQAYTDPPRQQSPVFHGYSRSGNVTGPLIYANYGSREDFQRLKDEGIDIRGSIALVRYYGTQSDRALKVKAAELAGAVGCIIYSDPSEDGFVKGEPFPKGRYRSEDSAQRGTVGLTSWVIGDVLSPGFASLPGEKKRLSKDNNPGLNNIPSIPLAWRDAQKLLQSLKGHGNKVNDKSWVGGVPNVEWWTGDHKSPIVHLKNEQEEIERQPVYNVLGRIEGFEQPEKSIIVGNHRDAWCFGAANPGSGTAVFVEVVRIFGELKKLGWQPSRTIEFASWDAKEYNLVGSTEHVEARIEDLRRNGYVYINVDVAAFGDDFRASGPPLLEKSLHRILGRVVDPLQNKTLRAIWEEKGRKLEGLGARSDYVAFQDIAGVSSIDFSFRGDPFPYNSCYDNFEWMDEQGDPGFIYHRLLGQVLALLVLELSDSPILPFALDTYAAKVREYVVDLESYAVGKGAIHGSAEKKLDLAPLAHAADEFVGAAEEFHKWSQAWTQTVYNTGGFESVAMTVQRIEHNDRMAQFEKDLLDIDGGLPGREQFKHVLFAPQAWSRYDEAIFPGIRDAIDGGDWKLAQRQVEKVAGIISRASRNLSS